jgi:hypothetical protein
MTKSIKTLTLAALSGVALASAPAVAQTERQQPTPQGSPTQPGTQPSRPMEPTPTGQEPGTTGQRPAMEQAELVNVLATVENVDKKGRKVHLKDPEGQRVTVQVPPAVQGFERLKKGDRVNIGYYESMAVALMPPTGTTAPMQQERVVGTRELGGGAVARELTVATKVSSVDPDKNTVTFKAPDGKPLTVNVTDPQLQQRLKELNPGDTIQINYTEAVAVTLEPQAGQQQKQPQR